MRFDKTNSTKNVQITCLRPPNFEKTQKLFNVLIHNTSARQFADTIRTTLETHATYFRYTFRDTCFSHKTISIVPICNNIR